MLPLRRQLISCLSSAPVPSSQVPLTLPPNPSHPRSKGKSSSESAFLVILNHCAYIAENGGHPGASIATRPNRYLGRIQVNDAASRPPLPCVWASLPCGQSRHLAPSYLSAVFLGDRSMNLLLLGSSCRSRRRAASKACPRSILLVRCKIADISAVQYPYFSPSPSIAQL